MSKYGKLSLAYNMDLMLYDICLHVYCCGKCTVYCLLKGMCTQHRLSCMCVYTIILPEAIYKDTLELTVQPLMVRQTQLIRFNRTTHIGIGKISCLLLGIRAQIALLSTAPKHTYSGIVKTGPCT